MRRLLTFAVAAVLCLAGCARPPIAPASLLTCLDQPKSPSGNAAAMDTHGANYVVDLAAAGQDCRSNLGSVRRLLTAPEAGR